MNEWRYSSTQCCRYPFGGVRESIEAETLLLDLSEYRLLLQERNLFRKKPQKELIFYIFRGGGHLASGSAEALPTPLHRRVLNLDIRPVCVVRCPLRPLKPRKNLPVPIKEKAGWVPDRSGRIA